jgi:putative membrane protein
MAGPLEQRIDPPVYRNNCRNLRQRVMERPMKFSLAAAMAVIAAAGLPDPSAARTHTRARTQGMSPETFVRQAAAANQFEIESSQLALQKAQNEKLKQYAQRMVEDHTKIADEMKQTLQRANFPEPPAQLPQEQQVLLRELKSKKGAAFDRSYYMDQLSGHRKAVHLIGGYARSGSNPDLKKLAAKTLPVIKEHMKVLVAMPGTRALSARR